MIGTCARANERRYSIDINTHAAGRECNWKAALAQTANETDLQSLRIFIADDYYITVIALRIGVALNVQTESYILPPFNYFLFLSER